MNFIIAFLHRKIDSTISPTFRSLSMHFNFLQKSSQQVLQIQNYTSIPISNPPPTPAIPIAEGADQAVMQNKTSLQNFYHMLQ